MFTTDHLAALDVLTRTYEGTPHGMALVALRLEIERLRAVERAARTYCREPTNQRFQEMAAAIVDYRTPP
ncbi:MAG TPA: hypothetical protein VFT99_00845, partial [Roseiflexaceae bacterium]|nr:hypothetical protein [Roseiflexaceae bacterium]